MEFNTNMKKMFGKRLRELRTSKMLTQETVAELIDIKPENYSRIENGLSFPKPENIVKISKVLNVEIAELFQFSHLNDYDKILDAIVEKLKTDKDTTVITYKFLKSIKFIKIKRQNLKNFAFLIINTDSIISEDFSNNRFYYHQDLYHSWRNMSIHSH